jgi:hypothetical protein
MKEIGAGGRGAAVAYGGIKLFGGTLLTAASVINAWLAVWDMFDSAGKGKYGLFAAYLVSAAAHGASAYYGFLLSFSASGPWFEYIAAKTSNQALQKFALQRAGAASVVALRTAVLLRVVLYANLAGIALSVLLWYLTDDALETWCQKSSFRKNPGTSPGYASEEEELKHLYEAFNEVTSSSGIPAADPAPGGVT